MTDNTAFVDDKELCSCSEERDFDPKMNVLTQDSVTGLITFKIEQLLTLIVIFSAQRLPVVVRIFKLVFVDTDISYTYIL